MILIALCFCYAGFMALYLAMPKHYKSVFERQPRPLWPPLLRLAGAAALGAAFAAAVRAAGWQIGPVLWFGLLSASVLLLVFLLPYAQRWLVLLPAISTPVALATALIYW